MYIQQLHIENLRSLKSATLELNHPGTAGLAYPNVNVLLGGNGMGKTSVLRAAALAALGPLLSSSSGYVPESLIRRPVGQRVLSRGAFDKLPPAIMRADLCLDAEELQSGKGRKAAPRELQLSTNVVPLGSAERLRWACEPASLTGLVEQAQFDERSNAFFVVGYGATRRVEASARVDESARMKSRLRRYERVSSLFEDHLGLMPLSYWLPAFAERNKGRYTQVLHLLDELLPANCRIMRSASDTEQGREHLFLMNGVPLPFRALSDGYRAFIGWIGDMLFHVCMGAGSGQKLRELSGVVLVDEIDLHLHPDWQRRVVPLLSRALPKVQFVVTTHSPLVVGSLEAGNLFLLAEEEGATVIKRLPERVHGRSAEQILLSPYFGLESTRSADASDQLKRLADRAASGDAKASMQYLELLSGGMSRPALAKLAPASAKPGKAERVAEAKKVAGKIARDVVAAAGKAKHTKERDAVVAKVLQEVLKDSSSKRGTPARSAKR